jgi:hypothetical protein
MEKNLSIHFEKTCRTGLATSLLAAITLYFGCSKGAEIITGEGDINGLTKSKKTHESSEGDNFSDGINGPHKDGFDGGKEEETEANVSGEVVYPQLAFKGNGGVSCGSNNPRLVDALSTTLTKEKLEILIESATISDAGKAEGQANEEIQKSIGLTTYLKPTTSEKKEIGTYNYAAYAIFAKTITKQKQGQTFVLEKPLPVFPWPAPKSRYAQLKKKGTESWSSRVTGGGRSFTSTVTITFISESGDDITLKFRNDILEDQPGSADHRAIYEIFPVAREATYTINTVTKDVRRIQSTHWFKGDNCNGAPSSVDLLYMLCKKTTGVKVDTFPCN